MRDKIIIVLLIAAVIALPVALQPRGQSVVPAHADDVLVLISATAPTAREEFANAFTAYWKQKTGRTVVFDWRSVGGVTQITSYLNAQYGNTFRNYWENTLHKPWTQAVAQGFADGKIVPNAQPPAGLDEKQKDDYMQAAAARAAFLASNVSIGIDIMFGGGSYDFNGQASRGQLVPDGVEQRHPDWFTNAIFPETFAGEQLRDPQGRWQGAALSSFGLIYNRDRLAALGFTGQPTSWADLADPRFVRAVALADPTQSGSNAKAFEMVIQQQMQIALKTAIAAGVPKDQAEAQAVAKGWLLGLALIQLASANSAYFTDSAPQPILDVAAGNCAMGMAIDFYGLIEEDTLQGRNPNDPARANRFVYIMPPGGSSLSPDGIALLRGAPHIDVAQAFIDFVLSQEGQKLWDFRPGTPGGPQKNALRHAPIRRDMYDSQWRQYLSDPDLRPYDNVGDFVYHASWTSPLFAQMRFIIKSAFMDPHPELASAWKAILRARAENRTDAANAGLAALQDLSAVDYATTSAALTKSYNAGAASRMDLEQTLDEHFRNQYLHARDLAEAH